MLKLLKKLFTKQDELVGIWQTTNDGGFHIMMGSELILNADGTGSLYSWGHGEEGEPYEYRFEVAWHRKSSDTIAIKTTEAEHFAIIRYKIEGHTGPYNLKYDMLYDPDSKVSIRPGSKGFWTIPDELYRKR